MAKTIEQLQAESRRRNRPVVITNVVEKVKVVNKVKVIEKPFIADREIIAFIKKVMHCASVVDMLLDRIIEERKMAKVEKVEPIKISAKPVKEKKQVNQKRLKFNPMANTKMVDWDKLRHF
jgi:hypothetical protein